MKLVKLNRFLGLALAIVCAFGAVSIPEKTEKFVAVAEEYNEPIVRVGMCVDAPLLDNRVFSSLVECGSGFQIGYSASDSFHSVLKLSHSKIILLPAGNANFDSAKLSCTSGKGNIGGYSAVIGKYQSYSEALNAANSQNGFVAVVNGGFEARAFSASSADEASAQSGGLTVKNPAGFFVLDTNGKIILSFEDSSKIFAVKGEGGSSLAFATKHRTGAYNTYSYLGYLEYAIDGGKLSVVNCIGLEDYTKCVMANEIGTNVSKETRKAFSVLARTVPLNSKHGSLGFDVCCNSACCQVYYGLHRMSEENNKIVESTRGLFCAYNGRPISVLYHNSNGGASCSSVAA